MEKLTRKQKIFADEYIKSGNATDSARKAGYKIPHVQGSENLRKPRIKEYIANKLKPIEEKRQIGVEDAINELINIMLGEQIESRSTQVDHLKKDKVVKDMTYKYSADVDQRVKAMELYLKYKGVFDKQQNTNIGNQIVFVDSEEEMKKYMEQNKHEYDNTDQ